MKLKVCNNISIEYMTPIVNSNSNEISFEDPFLSLICPHCKDIYRMRLFDGLHYDRKEAENIEGYLKDMRSYFLELTGGKFDIVSIFNRKIASDVMTKIEIELMTNPESRG